MEAVGKYILIKPEEIKVEQSKGGLLLTDKTREDNRYRNAEIISVGSFIHPEIGYNFRMTDIQSAIGLAQLEKLDEIIRRKKHILSMYKDNLDSSIKIIEPPFQSNHIPFRVCITVPGGGYDLMEHMKTQGIETRTFFYPLHKQPAYQKQKTFLSKLFKKDDFEVSERMYREGVCLPSFLSIVTGKQIGRAHV